MKFPPTTKVRLWAGKTIGIVLGNIDTKAIGPIWLRNEIQVVRDANIDPKLENEPVYVVLWNNGNATFTDLYYESELIVA